MSFKRKVAYFVAGRYLKKRRLAARRGLLAAKRRLHNTKKRFRRRVRRAAGIETKMITAGGVRDFVGSNNAAANLTKMDATIIRVDPNNSSCNIVQGVAQDQRIGNKVKLVRGTMRFSMWPQNNSAGSTSNLQCMRMICFYDKRNPTLQPTPAANGDFFQQAGTPGYTGFTGQMYDLFNKINQDRYHVFWERTFKLGNSGLVPVGQGGPGENVWNNGANNDFKLFHKRTFSLTKTCIKSLNYNDNQSNGQWRGCWIICFGVAPIGPANISEAEVANASYQIEWKYQDV